MSIIDNETKRFATIANKESLSPRQATTLNNYIKVCALVVKDLKLDKETLSMDDIEKMGPEEFAQAVVNAGKEIGIDFESMVLTRQLKKEREKEERERYEETEDNDDQL